MSYRKFNITLAVTFFSLSAILALINYIIDPYGIFRNNFAQQRREPNLHFVKMRYVLNTPQKYDSFLFGSSRVGKIDVSQAPGGRYYNFYYSIGLPQEFALDLQLLLQGGIHVKNVLVGLDEFTYKVDPESHYDGGLRHPYGNASQNFQFYLRYLFHLPSTDALLEFVKNKEPEVFYDVYKSGMPVHRQVDASIEANREQHVKDKKFDVPIRYTGNRIRETIAGIARLKELCEEHSIRLIFFINPVHKTTYLNCALNQFEEFKRQLARITAFYDFSGLNSITTDNYCYYETSHYRYFVGDLILARIFNRHDAAVPSDFGVLVNQSNIDEHLGILKARDRMLGSSYTLQQAGP